MEDKRIFARERHMIRRYGPWVMSLGLFAAGGWSVMALSGQRTNDAANNPEASTAQIQQLFGSGASHSNTAASRAVTPPPMADRYVATSLTAPDLPPLAAPKSIEPVAPAPQPSELAANRYAAALKSNDAADEPEVMRGQNPLRDSQVQLASAEEARDAFRASDQTGRPQPLQVAATPRSVEDALPPVQPLPAQSETFQPQSNQSVSNSRYGQAPAAIAVGASPSVADAPTPDFSTPDFSAPSAASSNYGQAAPAPAVASSQYNSVSPSNSDYRAPTSVESEAPSAVVSTPAYTPSTDNSGLTPTPGITSTPGTGRPGERLLEGAQSPSIAIQKLAPPEIQVGKKCTFAVRIKNIGQRAAQNVVINDVAPRGTKLIGTAPRAAVAGDQVKWDLGTLSVGEERIVEMELMPTDEGEIGSVATVSFAAQASAKSRSTRPELALRLTTKPRVMAGDQHLVQIELSNPGTGDATGVMLLETLPEGVSHEAGTALELPIGTLRAGESRRMSLVLNAERAGIVTNVMTARADANLEVTSSCEFEVIAPDLKLSVAGPKRKYLERPAKFVVNVDNPGTASAKDVQLVTQLPKGLQFVSANNMGEYDSTTHSVYWSLAELPANERGSVEVTALPVEPGDHTVKAATRAQNGLEDRAQSLLSVEGLAALKFIVVDQQDPIEIGGETSYEIRVMNQGSKAAANVQIVATLPDGLRAIDAKGETRHMVQGNRVVFSPLPQLAPKAETIYQLQVQGVRPGDQRIRVQITTDEIQQPITKEESTRVYADQ